MPSGRRTTSSPRTFAATRRPSFVASDRHIDRVADLPRRDRCVTDHTAHTQCPRRSRAGLSRYRSTAWLMRLRLRGVTVGRVDDVISRGPARSRVRHRHLRATSAGNVCTRALLEDAPDQAGADRRACLGIACIQPQHTGLWQHRRAQALITRLAEPLQAGSVVVVSLCAAAGLGAARGPNTIRTKRMRRTVMVLAIDSRHEDVNRSHQA